MILEGASPLGLAASVAALTLFSEDAALLGAAGLALTGRLPLGLAFGAAASGIILGDYGLFALGRWMRRWDWLRQRLGAERLARGKAWLQKAGFSGVLASRFIPGSRLPGYTAAGLTGLPFAPFAVAVFFSGLVWVGLVFAFVAVTGQAWGAAPAMAALVALALGSRTVLTSSKQIWRLRRARWSRWAHAEFWPPWFFYLPIVFRYLYLSVRYGHPLLPSAANPMIAGGGLINESKDEILRKLPKGPWTLRYQRFDPGAARAAATWMRRSRLRFPIIAKPDQGQRGSGVRVLRRTADLQAYAAAAPTPWLLQEYCPWPHEAGVFYVRRPGQAHGFLFSITEKRFPFLKGDGQQRLDQLILEHPRYRLQADLFFERHRARLSEVLPQGSELRLAEAGNHCQGTLFLDGQGLGGPGLLKVLDGIASKTPGFYLGRFDLRYRDARSFSAGKGFKLIELNLGGAEATHIYDPEVPLLQAYKALFQQWGYFFERGAHERARGAAVLSVSAFIRDALAYRRASAGHGGTD